MKTTLLPSESLTLSLGADGGLMATLGGARAAVSVRQAFPWSEPARFLSLRDEDDKEFALVEDVAVLEQDSRAALEAAVTAASFVLDVTAVERIEEEVEVRHWTVRTRQGPRTFQTRLDDWPRGLPQGGLLIRDVAGDLYRLPSPDEMDERSRALLWAFVD